MTTILPPPAPRCPFCADRGAYMYVYYDYAFKPAFHTYDETPYLTHEVQLHVVNKAWLEDEATTIERLTGVSWSETYLALDGTDVVSYLFLSGHGYTMYVCI